MSNEITQFEKGLSIMQEFYIEFFGTFIPGLIAVMSILLIALGVNVLFTGESAALSALEGLGTGLSVLFLMFVLCASYVVGAIVYRRAPKLPDAIASYREWSSVPTESKQRLSVEFKNDCLRFRTLSEYFKAAMNQAEWIRSNAGIDIDYPYPHLRRYLLKRGFFHLAEYVSWCDGPEMRLGDGKESANRGGRTKHYVNVIKQRIRMSGPPGLILDLVRNECHIRMLSSLWYILKYLRMILFCVMVLAMSGGAMCWYSDGPEEYFGRTIGMGILFMVLWAFVWKLKENIEKGFHYVRNREIVMILEGAYWMDFLAKANDKSNFNEPPFEDMRRQGRLFRDTVCSKCYQREQCDLGRLDEESNRFMKMCSNGKPDNKNV